MYLICTLYVLVLRPGFPIRGVLLNANMLVPDAQQPPADQDIDRGVPCQEDDEFFDRTDADTMEEAISQFMDIPSMTKGE